MEEYTLPIKTLKIDIDNHNEIPSIINFIKKHMQ